MWGPEQRDAFRRDGVVTLPGAFSAEAGAAMEDATWSYVEARTDIRRDDRSTWPGAPDGFATSTKKLKKHPAFRAVLAAPAVRSALDGIFGDGGWRASRNGAQILFSFPTHDAADWTLASGPRHMDAPFDARVDPPAAVKLFSVAAPLPPRSGATLALAGTSNLQANWARRQPAERLAAGSKHWLPFLREAHPNLRRLVNPDDDGADRAAVCGEPLEIDGQRVELREFGGDVGDVHVNHINTFHCPPVHAGTRPRLLITHLISPAGADRSR